MRFVALLLGLALSTAALADTKTVTWTNPTTNTDGTTIGTADKLVRATVEYGLCNAANTAIATKQGEIFVAEPATSLQLPLVVVQMYCLDAFVSNTFATTFVAGAVGNSDRSNVFITSVAPPRPMPPGGLTATGNLTAYQIVQAPNKVTLLAMGHVAPGTMCDQAQSVTDVGHGTLYLVPFDSVTLPNGQVNSVKQTVFASCG